MKNLLIRTLTGIFLIVLIVGAILLGELSFAILIATLFLLGTRELMQIHSCKPDLKTILIALSGVMLIAASYLINTDLLKPEWIILPPALYLAAFMLSFLNKGGPGRATIRFNLLSFFWLSVPLSMYLSLGWFENKNEYHYTLPLLIICLLWINDTFAYLIGSLFGKHKMTPILSPGKTWEGFFGGLLITVLAGWISFKITNSYTVGIWIIISITTVVFGFLGDISESKIKRIYKIKNSGSLLPGHGGILDRFDSLLLAAPAVFIVILIVNAIA